MTERARPNNKKSSYVEGAAPESSQKDTFWDSENDTSHTCYVLVLTRFTRCSRALHTHYHLHPVPEYWCVEESVAQAMRLARVTTTLRGARYTHIGLTDALPRNGRSPCVHVHHTRLARESPHSWHSCLVRYADHHAPDRYSAVGPRSPPTRVVVHTHGRLSLKRVTRRVL